LADYAATLSQGQLRALGFRLDRHTGRVRCPQRTTFQRVLARVNAQSLERALLLWQEQVLGPVQDRLVILDGKEIRHADVESVSAVSGTGRWLGSTRVREGSNEIPAARRRVPSPGSHAERLSRTRLKQPQMDTDGPSAAFAATTVLGLRREAQRHAAFGSQRPHEKRCRRSALPPQSKSLSSVRGVA